MRLVRKTTAMLLAGGPAMALAQTVPPSENHHPSHPPQAVVPAPSAAPTSISQPLPVPPPPEQVLAVWRAEDARCGGQPLAATKAVKPLPALSWSRGPEQPVTFTFRTDADGRPLGITPASPRYGDSDDLAPSLAAARFSPGVRESCSITFVAERQPLAAASPTLAMAYSVYPTNGTMPAALWERVKPVGSTCFRPAPAVLDRGFPDFKALPGEQGRPLWSMVAFDIDARGRPVRVRTADGSRSAALDTASRAAVLRSRFVKGARQGCLFPYRKNADPLPAPEVPATESYGATSAACRAVDAWARTPRLVYPNNYRRRGIEGWAVVQFDVAPWGAIGNAKVIAAEPTADFGRAGLNTIQFASKAPSATGASGCIDRVRFVMARPEAPGREAPGPEAPTAPF